VTRSSVWHVCCNSTVRIAPVRSAARNFDTRDSQGSIEKPAFSFVSAGPKQTQYHPRSLAQAVGESHQAHQ
jgi:hypothetical protein